MLKAILGATSALALASPAVAADLPIPPYSQAPGYQEECAYRTAPPFVVEEPPAVVVRRPVIVAPPVVVDEYPVYACQIAPKCDPLFAAKNDPLTEPRPAARSST